MSPTPSRTRWRSALAWLAAAPLLWLAAAAVDRSTEVVVENLGDHLRVVVAGTELEVPAAVRQLDRIALHAAASIDPPGGRAIVLAHGSARERWPLPHRFEPAPGSPPPVGDWWVDGRLPVEPVFDRQVDVAGSFVLEASLRGRFTNDLTLTLTGTPTLFVSLRRGLLDNYVAVKDRAGGLLAVTTLDPTPGPDLLAIAAQLLRAAAAACLLVAFVLLVALLFPGSPDNRIASPAPSPRRTPPSWVTAVVLLVLLGLGVAISFWVATDVLGGLPHQIDETIYLLQARWLLDGEVAPEATPAHRLLAPPFTYLRDGRWLAHYPVGWPALLAAGLAARVPHLATTVLGGIFVILVFVVGRELDDTVTGLAAATLVVVSPLARLMSATMFPHAACAVLVGVAVWLALGPRRLPAAAGAGIGLALGACLAVRPMTAVVVALVLGVWLLAGALGGEQRRTAWTTLASAVVVGVAASLPTLVHNTSVTGDPFTLPYSLASGTMYGPANVPFGIRNLDAILVSASAGLAGWGWPLVSGGLALALPLAFVGLPFLLRRARPTDWLLLAIVLAAAAAHLPTRANGLHGFGARYAFDVGICLVLLAARGWRELARAGRPSPTAVRTVLALFLVLNLTALAALPARLASYRGYAGVTGALERQLAASGLERAVILVDGDSLEAWCEGGRFMTGPRRHDIVVAAEAGDTSLIEAAYPDRPLLRWDGERLHRHDGGVH